MALQGDLQSFALPDVLRLLAGTSKTGRLAVVADDRTGDVWLKDGGIVAGAVSSSPHASEASDVVFELLRFERGSFTFEDGEEPAEAGTSSSVDEAIGQAEELVREWHEVEAVVPSVESWITLVPEIEGDHTTVSADHWRLLAIVAGGCTVRDLGDRFEHTDLAASRQVKELVEAGLVVLGDPPADRPAPSQAQVADAPAQAAPAPADHDDLSVLRADDGPVVLESSEDALLPEPLPGEGTSFEGDLADMAPVDRRYEADETDEGDAFDAFEAAEPAAAGTAEADPFGDPEPADPPVEDAPAAEADDPFAADDPFGNDDFFGSSPDPGSSEEVSADPLDSTPSTDAASAAAAEGDDDDSRGALLNFLSR